MSRVRNVKMALTTRFINNIFSTILLVERGLIIDSFNCSRSSIETTALYWLVCHDEAAAYLYEESKSVKPVKVRERLEKLGVDVSVIRDLYSLESAISHVGNPYDNLQIRWISENNGQLLVGGGNIPDVQRDILRGIILSVFRFVKFDEDYIVPDIDKFTEVISAIP